MQEMDPGPAKILHKPVRHLIGSLTTDQVPQSIGKRSERKSDSHFKSSLSFCLALFKAALLNNTFFSNVYCRSTFPRVLQ